MTNENAKERRRIAGQQYPRAAEIAAGAGLALVRHTEAHYSLRAPDWKVEIYPGNLRIFSVGRDRPFIPLPTDWDLIHLAEAAALQKENADV